MSELGFDLIDPMSSDYVEPTNAVIYGYPGSGKTALAMTAPAPLLIDFEKGGQRTAKEILTIAKAAGSDISKARIVQINYRPNDEGNPALESFQRLERVIAYLKSGKHEFQTVIIDPFGELQNLLMGYVLESFPQKRPMGGQPIISDWGKALDMAKKFISDIRGLNMHTIVVAHAEQPGNDLEDIHPLVTGKVVGPYLEGAMDVLGYLYVERDEKEPEKTQRILRVDTDGRVRSKNRGGKLPPLIANPNMTKIFARMES